MVSWFINYSNYDLIVFFRFSPQSMKFDQIASDKIWGKLSFKEIK